jgi:DNA polymerase-4
VTPSSLPSSTRERRTFDHDTLDPQAVRTALLESAVALGARLRARQQIAGALALQVAFADGSTITRTRTLPEPSGHTDDLRTAAYGVFQALHLQRAVSAGSPLRATSSPRPEAPASRSAWTVHGRTGCAPSPSSTS